jgi:hypothetical protein
VPVHSPLTKMSIVESKVNILLSAASPIGKPASFFRARPALQTRLACVLPVAEMTTQAKVDTLGAWGGGATGLVECAPGGSAGAGRAHCARARLRVELAKFAAHSAYRVGGSNPLP